MSTTAPELDRLKSDISQSMRDNWGVYLFEGILLILLGAFAVFVPVIATITTTIVFGWVFLIGGVVGFITSIQARHAPGFWWSLLSAVLGVAVGLMLLAWPISGTLSLTMLLAVYFVAEGITSIMYSIEHKREMSGRWGWLLLNGIIDLILAVIIVMGLPVDAAWALGLIVGIDLIFGGFALSAMAFDAKAKA
jgi:uncharacterized membrane protein HdeD (DUF308 family)